MACEVNNKEINSQCENFWYAPRTLYSLYERFTDLLKMLKS